MAAVGVRSAVSALALVIVAGLDAMASRWNRIFSRLRVRSGAQSFASWPSFDSPAVSMAPETQRGTALATAIEPTGPRPTSTRSAFRLDATRAHSAEALLRRLSAFEAAAGTSITSDCGTRVVVATPFSVLLETTMTHSDSRTIVYPKRCGRTREVAIHSARGAAQCRVAGGCSCRSFARGAA